jgi:DtxR family transcriptional regulator, iron-dependent repressor
MESSQRSETVDRYLETIYYIDHEGEAVRPGRLAEWLGVSAPTVTIAIRRMTRDGWVSVAPDRSVRLTDGGRRVAAEIVRRHRIVERYLTDVLGLDWATADAEAAGLAHGVSDIVLDRLDAHLGHPSTCPHGNVIPGRIPPKGRGLVRLIEVPSGSQVRVARVSEVAEHEAPQLLRTLGDAGVVPGTPLVPESINDREVVIDIGGEAPQRHRLSIEMAAAVWVEAVDPASGKSLQSRQQEGV